MEAPQSMLLGENEDWGTGSIPAADIVKINKSRSTTGAVDSYLVRHVSGGVSQGTFKSYKEGEANFASTENHGVWLDEEPPYKVYSESLTRLNTTNGLMLLTMTNKIGESDVTLLYYPSPNTLDRHLTMMTIWDAEHFTEAQREKMWAQYQPWERDSILKGIPMQGEGRVYPISDWQIECDPFKLPIHWPQLGGMDFGAGLVGGHPSGFVRTCFDLDNDVMYVTNAVKTSEPSPAVNAITLREWGKDLPWAWPHDGERRVDFTDGSSNTIAAAYRKEGLRLLREHATFPDGGFGREAAVREIGDRMQSGRFKVFKHLTQWFDEFRAYHRDDMKIVRSRDDLMSATEKAVMMRRHARSSQPFAGHMPPVIGMDYDPLAPGGGPQPALGSSFGGWEN